MSKSLRSLTKNRSFAHFWAKNERFARKTNERIPSPALIILYLFLRILFSCHLIQTVPFFSLLLSKDSFFLLPHLISTVNWPYLFNIYLFLKILSLATSVSKLSLISLYLLLRILLSCYLNI